MFILNPFMGIPQVSTVIGQGEDWVRFWDLATLRIAETCAWLPG